MTHATISFRPTKKLFTEFMQFVHEEDTGKSDIARQVFELGLEWWRKEKTLKEFYAGRLSFLAAAKKAGLTAYEFLELLKAHKTPFIHVTREELEEEIRLAQR